MLDNVVTVFHLLTALGVIALVLLQQGKGRMLEHLLVQAHQILCSEAKVPLPFLVSLLLYLPQVFS